MTKPRQIIYPLRYARALIHRDPGSEENFKRNFGALLGGNIYVFPLGRARGGIFILVKLAIEKTRKRRVILSPYTIPEVVNMVRFAGGDPVFVDVLQNSTNIDLDCLLRVMNIETACVIITHYHVNQSRLAEIQDICRRREVMLFDDCAIALGADFMGTRVGRITDASIFSMSGLKPLNFFWGGAITTVSQKLASDLSDAMEGWPRLKFVQYSKQIIKTLRYDVATKRMLFSHIVFPILRKKYISSEVQNVTPLSRIESTFAKTIMSKPSLSATSEWNRKLAYIDEYTRHRRSISTIYDKYFKNRSVSPETSDEIRSGSGYINYPIFVEPARRGTVYKDILSLGFDVGLSPYPNVHEVSGFTQIPGRSDNVSVLVRSVITLPTHPSISVSYAHKLACAVQSVLQDRT
jgi:perosamine synthetase